MNYLDKFKLACQQIDAQGTFQKLGEEPQKKPIRQESIERWTVYRFSLPVNPRLVKKIGLGFESKEAALKFIDNQLVSLDAEGRVLDEFMELDGIPYLIKYDVIRDSLEKVDVYFNEPEITSVGNDRDIVLEHWIG